MKFFAVFLVVIAGTMWAGSGLAAQHFLAHNDHTAMDLTVFRMISTALIIFVIAFMRGTLGRSMRILKEYPTLWIKLIFYGLGLMLMQHTYFAGIGAGNAAVATVIQYSGYSDSVYMPRTCYLLGGSAKKKGTGDG